MGRNDFHLCLLLIPLLPFLGFLVNGVFGHRMARRSVHLVALAATGASFAATALVFSRFLALPERVVHIVYFQWIQAGTFSAPFGLLLDPLSMVMLLVVTGVGFLIHVYSTAYMREEGGYARFFAYMNLFMAAMLTLVMADNYLLLFVGWEGVGLCSYLLIGFYYQKTSAADAGKKAFIVNRIGDFGFVAGVLLLFSVFGTVSFHDVFRQAAPMPVEATAGVLTAITLLMFVGATGKSAQIPLFVWLPDAMEGPTPVSALIHAATMVTAGVYMVVRSHPLFLRSPETLFWIGAIGACTALFAAVVGLFQRDIKRVLAYSTVSQLGYMFAALGVAAFSAGMFHLVTHAFFKALLFLGSGSVIMALHHEQDLQRMGGLRKSLPVTSAAMWAGTLAISGTPFLSGFFSKDEILWKAFSSGSPGHFAVFGTALLAAVLTAFYMFRLMILAFHGESRLAGKLEGRVHEPPRAVTSVLAVLAALSVLGGYIGLPAWLGPNAFEQFLRPVFEVAPVAHAAPAHAVAHSTAAEVLVTLFSVLAAGAGALGAWALYLKLRWTPESESRLGAFHRLVTRKFYVDEAYNAVFVRPLHWLSEKVLWKKLDEGAIDGAVNGYGDAARLLGCASVRSQSGKARAYFGWVAAGVALACLATFFIARF